MWKDAHYENLSRCSIEMMQFCHCHNTLNPKDETGFRTAFEKAKEEGRTPALDNAVLYLRE